MCDEPDEVENFAHAMHVGWVKSVLEMSEGLVVRYVYDGDNEPIARLRVVMDDPANSFELIVPPK